METNQNTNWGRENWIICAFGLFAIIIGYIALRIPPADGFISLTLAPVLLVSGYCVIIPLAILYRRESKGEQ